MPTRNPPDTTKTIGSSHGGNMERINDAAHQRHREQNSHAARLLHEDADHSGELRIPRPLSRNNARAKSPPSVEGMNKLMNSPTNSRPMQRNVES